MKKVITAFVLAVASVGIVVPPAEADTPRCVTKAEYRNVHRGHSMGRVHRVFDIRGRRVALASGGGVTTELRSYRTCRRNSAVSVSYKNRRLVTKSAVWSG